jgi:hypothetical protein
MQRCMMAPHYAWAKHAFQCMHQLNVSNIADSIQLGHLKLQLQHTQREAHQGPTLKIAELDIPNVCVKPNHYWPHSLLSEAWLQHILQ